MEKTLINKKIIKRVNIVLTVIFIIEFIFIFLYELFLLKLYWGDLAYKLGKIHINFAYGFSMAFLFYLVTVIIPRKIRQKEIKVIIDSQVNNIKETIFEIYNFFITNSNKKEWLSYNYDDLRTAIQERQRTINISDFYLIKQDKNTDFSMAHVTTLEDLSMNIEYLEKCIQKIQSNLEFLNYNDLKFLIWFDKNLIWKRLLILKDKKGISEIIKNETWKDTLCENIFMEIGLLLISKEHSTPIITIKNYINSKK